MADSTRGRYILVPRQHLAYGQDFNIAGMAEHCKLSYLFKRDGKYHLDGIVPELVVSQNPDDPADAALFSELREKAATVAIQHCRWNFFDELQKTNVEKTLASATLCVAAADFHRDEMKSRFSNTAWRVAANGVRPDIFRPATLSERQEFRHSNLIDPSHLLVGFVGRLEPAKGTQILKRFAEKIKGRPVALFVQFPGWQAIREKEPVWKSYTDYAQEIRLSNHQQVVARPDLHPRATDRPARFFDLLLLPSLSEVQPLVVLEALACGVPVIATDSTPFLNRLRKSMPAISDCLTLIELDERFKQGNVARTTIFTDEEVDDLTDKILDRLTNVNPFDFSRRERISSAVLEYGFSEASMNGRLSSIFDEAVEQFDAEANGGKQLKRYPLRAAYIGKAPEQIGVMEFFRGNDLVKVTSVTEPSEGIRSHLALELSRQNDEQESKITHFLYEVCDNPQKRALELLEAHAATPNWRSISGRFELS
jgi:glycosyltransferase involved in cell wall biosynthesis